MFEDTKTATNLILDWVQNRDLYAFFSEKAKYLTRKELLNEIKAHFEDDESERTNLVYVDLLDHVQTQIDWEEITEFFKKSE